MPIEVRGLNEVIAKMQAYPEKLQAGMKTAMDAALLVVWENVPPYPPQPSGVSYRRTGTLGRSLGSGEGGGKSGGEPEIYEVRALGAASYEGRFGTNLEYARYVIGDDDQNIHLGYWWQMKDVAARATEKVQRVFADLGRVMADWLDSQ